MACEGTVDKVNKRNMKRALRGYIGRPPNIGVGTGYKMVGTISVCSDRGI
jgi:hypothetical protein